MSTRRKFLQRSALGSAAVLAGKFVSPNTKRLAKIIPGTPIVISTWDFDKIANAGAWGVLSKGGRALDAVKTGVRISEANP